MNAIDNEWKGQLLLIFDGLSNKCTLKSINHISTIFIFEASA